MPYFITDEADSCPGWAVVKEDGEVVGCHDDKDGAVEQMVAISQDEGMEPGGTYEGQNEPFEGNRTRNQGQSPEIEASESRLSDEQGFTDIGTPGESLTPDRGSEDRALNLDPPAFMRAAARQGLKYVEEGKGGGGLKEKTIREARAMAEGNVTSEKWVRLRAWIARHMPDLDAPAADPDNDKYPSPGVVAHLLWGSGPTKRGAERAMKYADRVVGRLEAEQKDRGHTLPAIETRETPLEEMEVRENADGMFFEGYAALFDSPSKPLPFTERIAPGAFIRSLKSRNDIKLLWNHDTSEVLGSTRSGTMKLVEDERGLKVVAQLPNTTTGRDAAELLKRGDVDAMSFGFTVPRGGDDWSEDGKERTLREVMLHEVSIVAFPAYEGTSGKATVRGLERVAQRANVDLDALSDALVKLEMGEDMTEEDTRLLNEVLDSIAPEKPAEDEDNGKAMLELKKQKLKLLELING